MLTYKLFEKSQNGGLYCAGQDFVIGKKYSIGDPIQIGTWGYHSCPDLDYLKKYCPDDRIICECEASGNILQETYVLCSSEIQIIKIISEDELANIS